MYDVDSQQEAKAVRVTLSTKEDNLINRGFQSPSNGVFGKGFFFSDLEKDPDANVDINKTNYPDNYRGNIQGSDPSPNDIAVLTTNNPLLPANKVIGLIAFVDPQDAIDKLIETAGYPGDNIPNTIDDRFYTFNNPGIPGNSAPNNTSYSHPQSGRDLIKTSGTIETIDSNGFISFSPGIDGFQGQSGSGVWHTLDGDDFPRVLGIFSAGQSFPISRPDISDLRNKGVLITTDIYDNIMGKLPIVDPDELPENAIIGSKNSDEIVGSYRKERILGNDGNDILLGHGAADRLEGGEGDDLLDGGFGEDQDDLKGDAGNDVLLN